MTDDRAPQARPYSADELAALSGEEQFLLQHKLTYGPGLDAGAYPEDAVLPVGNHTPPKWEHHPVADAGGQHASLEKLKSRGVYRTLAPMTGLKPGRKGTSKQVTFLPGIVFDLDTIDGVHEPSRSGLPDPDREQARELLAALAGHGVKLTYVLDTGGGYQAAVILDRPFSPRDGEEGAHPALPAKAAKALKAVCDGMGVAHDAKLTKGAAYPMRVAGGFNRKAKPSEITEKMAKSGWTPQRLDQIPDDIGDRPVRLAAVTGETMSAEALESALDAVIEGSRPPEEPPPPRPAPGAGGREGEPEGYRHACGATSDPRDQVCLELPMSRIVRELTRFSFEDEVSIPDAEDADRKLTWTDDPGRGTSAELVWRPHPGTGVTRACVVPYGNSTGDDFGSQEQSPQCAFWYLRNACCSGNTVLAYALIAHFTGDDGRYDADGLLRAAEACTSAEQVRAAFPGLEEEFRAAQRHPGGQDGPPDIPALFARALGTFDGRRISLGPVGEKDCYVIVGGPLHGTWLSEQVWDAKAKTWREKPARVWDAVAGTRDSAVYADGDTPAGEPLARAFITDRHGRTAVTGLLPVRDAYSPVNVWESLRDAKVTSPEGPDCKRAVATSLKILDLGGDSGTYQTAMGWHLTPAPGRDRWHYNGATSGVAAAGRIEGVWRKPPDIERSGRAVIVHLEDGVSRCRAATGWPDVPASAAEVAEAAAWIGQLRGITPGRLDLHLTLLGTYFAAPLHGTQVKPAVFLVALPGAFKSGLAASYHPFLTGLPVSDRNLTYSLKGDISQPGASGERRTWNDAVVVLDDAADNSDRSRNSLTNAIFEDAVKAAYGMADSGKADGRGGTRIRRASRCAVLITSEKSPAGEGITSRALILRMARGDVADGVKPLLNPGIAAGLPQQLYAGYIRHLACLLDAEGEDALRDRAERHEEELYARLGRDRAVEAVASVYAGLMMLAEFLEAAGCRDALATREEINDVIGLLVQRAAEGNREESLGNAVARHIAEELSAGRLYLEGTAHLEDPSASCVPADSLAVACGWRQGDRGWRTDPKAVGIGFITDEDEDGRRYVHIPDASLKKVMSLSGRPESGGQAREAMAPLAAAKFRGTARPVLAGKQRRGLILDPETLGIFYVPVSQQAARLSDGSLPPAPSDVVPSAGTHGPRTPEPAPSSRVPAPREAGRGQGEPGTADAPRAPARPVPVPAASLFPETATSRRPKPARPWTRAQVEAAAKKVPRVLPQDWAEVEGIP
jgi:hypothetical protein